MKEANPMKVFQKEAPQVAKAFDGLIQAIVNSKGLDEKTKQLIYIAMKSALDDPVAVKFHVAMAKNWASNVKRLLTRF